MLTCAKQVARAANFKIAHRNRIACAKLRILRDHLKPLLTFLRGRHFIVAEEIRIRPHRAAPHTSAELIELRQAKRIRAINDQRVGVGNIQA